MKQKNVYSILFVIAVITGAIGTLKSQNKDAITGWSVKEISKTNWGSPDGIPYIEVPGANLGATSFAVMDANRVAYLSNASNEIIITDKSSGKAIKNFPISFVPRNFVYDKGLFYVLDEYDVVVYDETGKNTNKFSFPDSYIAVVRLTRFNNSTYLLLPTGNSLMIESNGKFVTPKEYDGWITSSGLFVVSNLTGDKTYSLKIKTATGITSEKEYSTDIKVAGAFVIGSTENRLIMDVQMFISENPIIVERRIVAIELDKNGLGNIVASIKVPDCYYVLSFMDFYVSANGTLLNMLTSPGGIYVFSLEENNSMTAKGYPASIMETKYHFNDHLLKVD